MVATCSCALDYEALTTALDSLASDVDRGLGDIAQGALENVQGSTPEVERNCGVDLAALRTVLEPLSSHLASFAEKQRELGTPVAREVELVRENLQADIRTLRRDLHDQIGRARETVDTTMEACTSPACICAKAHVDLSNLTDRAVTVMGTANPVDLREVREQFRPALEGASHVCAQPAPAEHTFADIETALDQLVDLAPLVRSPQRRSGPYITLPVPGAIVARPEERITRVPGKVIEYTPQVKFRIGPKIIQEVVQAQLIRGPPERVTKRVRRTPEEERYDDEMTHAITLITDADLTFANRLSICAAVEQGITPPPASAAETRTALAALIGQR